ncbi:DinB family protein [bacterium]|nr:DinB family protein [bacterium]
MEIGKEVQGHLNQMFSEIESAVGLFPDALWGRQTSENILNIPCFLAHHTVWCMVLSHLLRIPEERLPHNLYPDYGPGKSVTQRQVLDLLADIRDYVGDVCAGMSNEDYLKEDEKGASPLGRILYTLAHTRHHYGQLVQMLRSNGLQPPDWYPIQ